MWRSTISSKKQKLSRPAIPTGRTICAEVTVGQTTDLTSDGRETYPKLQRKKARRRRQEYEKGTKNLINEAYLAQERRWQEGPNLPAAHQATQQTWENKQQPKNKEAIEKVNRKETQGHTHHTHTRQKQETKKQRKHPSPDTDKRKKYNRPSVVWWSNMRYDILHMQVTISNAQLLGVDPLCWCISCNLDLLWL